MAFHKILVAIDSSPLCQSVFARALELAQTNGASLMLFHCLMNETLGEPITPIPMEMGFYPEIISSSYEAQKINVTNQIEQAQVLLHNYCETARNQGVQTEYNYKIGDAGTALCEAAQDWGADLIIMGRRGRSGLTEALLGSVSNYVLHHAPCCLLVVQSPTTGK